MQLPAHLLAEAGGRTLCGIGRNNERCYPLVMVSFLPAHHRGHGLVACSVCADKWSAALVCAFATTAVPSLSQ